jgi:hypothetical protein
VNEEALANWGDLAPNKKEAKGKYFVKKICYEMIVEKYDC